MEPGDTVETLIERLADKSGEPTTRIRLIYQGKHINPGRTLQSYDINRESTVHMLLRPPASHAVLNSRRPRGRSAAQVAAAVPAPPTQQGTAPEDVTRTTTSSQFPRDTEEITGPDSFDTDEDIIDPINYRLRLERISNNVAARSEFKACGGLYGRFGQNSEVPNIALPESHQPTDGSGNIPTWMQTAARSLPPNTADQLESVEGIMADLWKTCLIVDAVLSSIAELQQHGLCGSSFNVLANHSSTEVAELVRIEVSEVEAIMQGILSILEQLWTDNESCSADIPALIRGFVLALCEGLVLRLNPSLVGHDSDMMPMLDIIRMVAVVLDLGLLSYVGSHGIRFDRDYLRTEKPSFEILWMNSILSCSCSLTRLACLRGFLDGRAVWVIRLQLQGSAVKPPGHQPASILTTIQEFADIWGPVYAIPDSVHPGKIQQYNVSKGIIRTDGKRSPLRNAVKCHWYNERSWKLSWQRMGRRIRHQPESLLSPDDLLLIGDIMIEKEQCTYTLDEFEESYGNMLTELGTRESEWRWDTRGASIGIGGSLRISVFGTQRRIPDTPQKQMIIDKWKSAPEQRNPHMLGLQLGVEVSHCTGNARRLAVKDLFRLQPVARRLEQQFPAWSLTDWGVHFQAAIEHAEDDNAAILQVWRTFAAYRSKIAAMVTYILDLLSPTGLDDSCFKVAFLNHGCEAMLSLSVEKNTWARLLKDTRNSSAFALVTDRCLECRLPNHIAPYCCRASGPQSGTFTVLQSRILAPANSLGRNRFVIMPVGERFRRVELGSDAALLFMPETNLRGMISTVTSLRDTIVEVVESSDPMRRWGVAKTIYIRASVASSGGMASNRNITIPVQGELWTWPQTPLLPEPPLVGDHDLHLGAQNSLVGAPGQFQGTQPDLNNFLDGFISRKRRRR